MPRVRLPRTSSRRNESTHIKLIERIRPDRCAGLAFQGKHFRGGDTIEETDLWPTPDFPARPLLLELGGIATPGWGHNRSSHWHLLWRYVVEHSQFEEIARVEARGIDWVEALKYLAIAELGPERPKERETASRAAQRIVDALEAELKELDGAPRLDFLALIADEIEKRTIIG